MGIPGSGKTSGISAFIHESGFTNKDFVLVGLDEMSLSLPEYLYGLNLPLDTAYSPDQIANTVVSDELPADALSSALLYQSCLYPARKLTTMMINKSFDQGYNIIYDGTGQNPAIYKDLIHRSKAKNYKTIVIYVNSTTDVVWPRVLRPSRKNR